MRKHRVGLVTAHLMGGCAMGEDEKRCVVDSYGSHHQIENLSVFDGSIFPSSIGANPQLSIYGFTARNTSALLRSEEHTSELQSLMRISYAVFCLKKKKTQQRQRAYTTSTTTKLITQN